MEIFKKFLFDPEFDRLSNTIRWNGLNRIKDETVAHHSHTVSIFSMIIAEEVFGEDDSVKLQVLSYAVLHDYDEIFTGDILSPVKYNELNGIDLREEIDRFVDHKVSQKFPDNTATDLMFRKYLQKNFPSYIYRLVKIADWLSMYHYIKKEITLGNKGVEDKKQVCIEGIRESAHLCLLELRKFDFDYILDTKILYQIKDSNYE